MRRRPTLAEAQAERARRDAQPPRERPAERPPVTVIRPVCGIDHAAEETLGSTFRLAYPAYEIIFCVSDPADPVALLVERLIAANPDRPARLLAALMASS